jgi:tetratricopeptide (TPR) repeat protein
MRKLRISICIIYLFFGMSCYAEALHVTSSQQENTLSVIITLPAEVTCTVEQSSNELLLRFSQSVPAERISKPLINAGTWLYNIEYGYDSVLFTTQENVQVQIQQSTKQIDIQMKAAKAGQLAEDSRVQSMINRAQVYYALGKHQQANRMLSQLRKQFPINIQVLLASAGQEYDLQRFDYALDYLTQAESITVDNDDIAMLHNLIARNIDPFVFYDFRFKQAGEQANERIHRLRTEFTHDRQNYWIFTGESNNAVINNLVDIDTGQAVQFNNVKHRGKVQHRYQYPAGHFIQYGPIFNENEWGFAVQLSWWQFNGSTALELAYRQPEWDLLQALTVDGTRDTLRLVQTLEYNAKLSAIFDFSLNQFAIPGDKQVASSFRPNIFVQYQFDATDALEYLLGLNGAAYLQYNFSGEFPIRVNQRTGNNGVSFKPLIVDRSSIHTFALVFNKNWLPQTSMTARIGYAFDVFATHTVIAALNIEYKLNNQLSLYAHVDRLLGSESSGGRTEIAGVGAKWIM